MEYLVTQISSSGNQAVNGSGNLNNVEHENSDTFSLTGYFFIPKSRTPVKINLNSKCIELIYLKNESNLKDELGTKVEILNISDVAGSTINSDHSKKDKSVFFTIYAYPKRKVNKKVTDKIAEQKNFIRKRYTVDLGFSNYSDYNENLRFVNQWRKKLESIIKNKEYLSIGIDTKKISNDEILNVSNNDFEKPFLIFVNPHSGSAKAKSIYNDRIVPLLNESNTPDNVVYTSNSQFELT